MKISSGGIGTVATSQACNAKAAYPYQWAWNAIGETFQDGPSQQTDKGIQWWGMASNIASAEADPAGIKFTHDGSGTPFPDLWDSPATNVSGQLNRADTSIGRYMHAFFDFTGGATGSGTGANATGTTNILYWYPDVSGSHYSGNRMTSTYTVGTTTVFIYDMWASPQDAVGEPEDLGTWADMINQPEGPTAVEPFILVENGSSWIWKGLILADRILGPTEISFPIDISKARS
jgi:hypothetical protein